MDNGDYIADHGGYMTDGGGYMHSVGSRDAHASKNSPRILLALKSAKTSPSRVQSGDGKISLL